MNPPPKLPRGTGALARAVSQALAAPVESLQAAQAALEHGDLKPALRSDAHKARGMALLHAGQPEASLLALQQAVAASREAGDPLREARAWVNIGIVHLVGGRPEAAMTALLDALTLAGPATEVAAIVCLNLGLLAEQLDEGALALEFAQRGRRLLPAGGMQAAATINVAAALCRQRRLAEARPLLDEALQTLAGSPEDSYRLNGEATLAWLSAQQGRPETAVAELERVVARAESAGLVLVARWARPLLGEALLLAGRAREATVLGEQCLRELQHAEDRPRHRDLYAWLARAWGQLGQWQRAFELLQAHAEHVTQQLNDPQMAALRRRLYAVLDGTEGPLALPMRAPAPAYTTVLGVAKRLGLTAHDSQLLHGINAGKTNPQIAAEMGLSINAVRNRLSRVMRKLGVATRTAASRRALELGVIRRVEDSAGSDTPGG